MVVKQVSLNVGFDGIRAWNGQINETHIYMYRYMKRVRLGWLAHVPSDPGN